MLLVVGACAAGDTTTSGRSRAGAAEESSGAIETPSDPYREVKGGVANGGSIRGIVAFTGAPPADSLNGGAAAGLTTPCGTPIPPADAARGDTTLGNAVVWIGDIRKGRELPLDRRLEVVHEDCVLAPRVLAAVVGTTINVRNQDPVVYRLRAVRDGSHDTVAVFRFGDAGQVVPSEKIARRPGLVALENDRSTMGWIVVLDHPYFAVTARDGAFRFDSVPPGKYHVRVWHERGRQVVEQAVEVKSGAEATLLVRVPLEQ